MNELTVRIEGGDVFERDLAARELKILRSAEAAMVRMAEAAADTMRASMRAAASPSPPGSPPGIHTGNLLKGVYSANRPGTLKAVAGITAHHWHLLEFGTVKMAARPVIRPSGKAVALEGERIIKESSQRLIDGGG